jgi:galactokinase/mevalonate kinase-like predicted kinase
MALHYTDIPHNTPSNVDNMRDYDLIEQAAATAKDAVFAGDIAKLGEAISLSYAAQLKEGMLELPEADACVGHKYCGGGWGGYALYLFEQTADRDAFVASASCNRSIEPYITIR